VVSITWCNATTTKETVPKDSFDGSWPRHSRGCDPAILWMLLLCRRFINRQFTRLPSAAARTAGTHTFETVSKGFCPTATFQKDVIRGTRGVYSIGMCRNNFRKVKPGWLKDVCQIQAYPRVKLRCSANVLCQKAKID